MIVGEYPCCGGLLMIPLADQTPLPCAERAACPHCGATVWHIHSRLDPASYTDEDFHQVYHVDPETKRVTAAFPNGLTGALKPETIEKIEQIFLHGADKIQGLPGLTKEPHS